MEERCNQIQNYLEVYLETGNEEMLRDAINIGNDLFSKGNNDAGYLLAQCLTIAELDSLEFGSLEKSIEIYEKLIKYNYSNNYVVLRLGMLYQNTEQLNKAFECYKCYHELEPNDDEGVFYLAKSYNNGIGIEQNLELAKKLFDSILCSDYSKNNEFFAYEYAELNEKIGLYCDANKWYEMAFSLSDDALAKASYAKNIIFLHLNHNPFGYSTPSSIIKNIERYIEKIEEIDRQNKNSSDYEDIHEAYLIVKNGINIFLAKNGQSQASENVGDIEKTRIISNARNAAYNKNYPAALEYYRSILAEDPQNIEAIIFYGLLENNNCTIENYSQKLNNINRAVAENNIRLLRNALHNGEAQTICRTIARTTVDYVEEIYTVLNDTFNMLVSTRTTFNRLSPVGFSRNILYPKLYEMAQLQYDLGDSFERVFGATAYCASCDLWTMGNAYMTAYMNSLGFIQKQGIKGIIRKYTSKIR